MLDATAAPGRRMIWPRLLSAPPVSRLLLRRARVLIVESVNFLGSPTVKLPVVLTE